MERVVKVNLSGQSINNQSLPSSPVSSNGRLSDRLVPAKRFNESANKSIKSSRTNARPYYQCSTMQRGKGTRHGLLVTRWWLNDTLLHRINVHLGHARGTQLYAYDHVCIEGCCNISDDDIIILESESDMATYYKSRGANSTALAVDLPLFS